MTNRIEDLFPTAELDSSAADDAAPTHAAIPERDQGTLHSAMSAVATGYAAAHGHPLEHDGFLSAHRVRRRWALGMRAGVILIVLIGVIGAAISIRAVTGSKQIPVTLDSPPEVVVDVEDEIPGTQGPQPGTEQQGAGAVASVPDGTEQDQGPSGHAVVHVAGQVADPGVVTLVIGARVSDAVTAAGGLTGQADPAAVNLARVIQDGEQIYVPAMGEEPPALFGGPAEQPHVVGGGPEQATQADSLVDLNTATQAQLETLPGIGPALASRIIAWRETNGGFAEKSDLMSVSGIGPAVMGNVQDLITVD